MKRFFPFLGISFLIHIVFFTVLNTYQKEQIVKVTRGSSINIRLKELIIRDKKESHNEVRRVENKSINKISKNNKRAHKINETILDQYILSIYKRVEANKFYPRRAKILRHEGKLEVEIMIAQNGRILSSKYLSKSTSKYLNEATLTIFKKIKSFDNLPSEISKAPLKVVIPVTYQL